MIRKMHGNAFRSDLRASDPPFGARSAAPRALRRRCHDLKLHEMTGNDQQRVWEHHLGVGTVIVGPRRV